MTSDTQDQPLEAWSDLLAGVLDRFGENSFLYEGDWVEDNADFGRRLRTLVIDESIRAEGLLASEPGKRQVIASNLYERPHACAHTLLRPDDVWFLREGKPWHQPPDGTGGGLFYLDFFLNASRPGSLPDWFFPPEINVSLHISYEMCDPFRWLLHEWHRLLELMIRPFDDRPWINRCDRPQLKGFRGKNGLKEIELYLQDTGDDPAFSFGFSIREKTPPKKVTRDFAVLQAIWDSLYMLTCPRCDPDRLHKHFLRMKDHLIGVPFRESFYDPGIDLSQLDQPTS